MNKYNSKIAKWFKPKNYRGEWAVTLGQTTYYSCNENKVDPYWRAHENKHKEQWKRDGKIKFLIRYIWQYYTKGYDSIDYEIEARAYARKI